MSLARTMFKNTFWLGVSSAIQMFFGFFVSIFLARYLGNIDYGKYVFVFSFTGLFGILVEFGFSNFLINEIARDKSKLKDYLENVLALKIIISILFLFLVFLLLYFTNKPLEVKIFIYISSIAIIFNSFTTVFYSVFRAYEQMKNEAIIIVALAIINFVLVFFAIFKEFPLLVFFEINLLVSILGFLLALLFVRRKFVLFSLRRNIALWKRILKNIIPFVLSGIFMSIYFYTDQVMLSFLKGDQATGWYGAVYKIFSVFFGLSAVYFGVFYPVVSRLYTESREKLELLLKTTLKISFIIFLPISLIIFLLAKPIMLLLYGNDFLGGVLALQIIIWIILLFFISPVYSNTLLACSQRKVFTIGTLLGTITNVVLNFLLIPAYSLNGAAAATLISQLVVFIYMFYMLSKKIIYINFLCYIAKPLIASIFMGVFVYLLCMKNVNLFVILFIGIIVYSAIFILLKGIKKEDLLFIYKLLKEKNVKS